MKPTYEKPALSGRLFYLPLLFFRNVPKRKGYFTVKEVHSTLSYCMTSAAFVMPSFS